VFSDGGMRETHHARAARRDRQHLGLELSVLRRQQRVRAGALAGNAVLYKPSEYAMLTGLEIGNLLHASGVPQDVFSVLVGGGRVGIELLKEPVDGVFFTGSYATGARIAQAVARA
jgi:acyl-CoA reductase-like NAD-dependent aldehyde dehydrogenase